MRKSIIIIGPQGCGKTTNTERFKKFFGLETVVDDGLMQIPTGLLAPEGVLYLVQELPHQYRRFDIAVLTFEQAIDMSKEGGKYGLRGYGPNYFSGFDSPPEHTFNTLTELFNIDWVKRFIHGEFCGFALGGPNRPGEEKLMATYKNGTEWWVIGFVSETVKELGLPKWKGGQPGLMPEDGSIEND